MLRMLKESLITLSKGDLKQFENKVGKNIQKNECAYYSQEMKNFIVMLPDIIDCIRVWFQDYKTPSNLKRLHGFVLTYLYAPNDLIKDETNGLFGYLDDVYLAAQVFKQSVESKSDLIDKHPQASELHKKVLVWLKMAQNVIPRESYELDQLIKKLIAGQDSSIDELIGLA